MKIVWRASARQDLNDIVLYIADDNPQAALRMLERIERRTADLAEFPNAGRPGKGGRRELVVAGTPYIVFYFHHAERIEIIAIMHGARDR